MFQSSLFYNILKIRCLQSVCCFMAFFSVVWLISSCHQKQVKESQGDTLYAQAKDAAYGGDIEKACQLLQKALAIYQKDGHDEGMAESLLALAQMKTHVMQVDTALIYIDKALDIHVGDSLRAALLGEKGSIYIIKGDLRYGIHFIRQTMQEYGDAYTGEDKAVGCGNAAVACRRLGMADSARFFLDEGIKAARQVGDDEDLAFLFNNLTTYFTELNRYDEALEASHKAREAALRADEEIEGLGALVNEGGILNRKGDRQKALRLLEEVLPRVDSTGFAPMQVKTLTYLLQTCLEMNDDAKVDKYLARSEQLVKQMPSVGIQAVGLLEVMADIKIGKGDYHSALQLLNQVDTSAITNGTYPREAYLKQKASIMAGMGDYRQAYQFALQSAAATDSLRGEAAQRQLSELSSKLKAQERETEIARLKKAVAQRQFYVTLFAAALIILALLVAAYVYWQRRRKEQVLAQRYVEGLERERARFARELHDGACNELLGIGMAINTQQAPRQEVAGRVSQLRDTLRHISHELMPPQFEKATLDGNLGHYLQQCKSPALDITFTATGDFSKVPRHIAYEFYRITQEALGNIFSHAAATETQVILHCENRKVSLRVSDNGRRTEEAPDDGGANSLRHYDGIGLQSISERAKSIGADLCVNTTDQGTTLTIITPL